MTARGSTPRRRPMCSTGSSGARASAPVLLDLRLPRLNGWQVIERIRASSLVPILLVTARGSEQDKIRGLGAGADDYVTKPLSFPELMARIEAVLRRAIARAVAIAVDDELRHPGLVI